MTTEKTRWTHDDDRLLCSAWLNVGTDPVIGVDQVSKAVDKFVGCFDHILNRRESRLNDEDRKMRALELYHQNEESNFKYLHYWEVLKNEDK
ncbi:Glutathione S-transferase T3 [Carex littledalei]|uniref:Glutathione S-transferase T3 n=1 Tax=Carex littledalei TaxID=544730 RepID=A0A833VEV0_9POAL|nr:Glutathione S-transferase T3 [Carex littledalei]